jgi:DNA-directed RNA polymerase subunit RPC12/RpoP
MLSERLKAFSEGSVTSFAQLCEKMDFDPDDLICVIANHSPRNVIRICEKIIASQEDENQDSSLVSVSSFDRGITAYCEENTKHLYGEDTVRELERVGREVFTINFLANDVFKFHTNSARNKVAAWENSGCVRQNGTLSVSSAKRPLNLYLVTDPSLVRLIHRRSTVQELFQDAFINCSSCGTDILMKWDAYDAVNPPICVKCGRELL